MTVKVFTQKPFRMGNLAEKKNKERIIPGALQCLFQFIAQRIKIWNKHENYTPISPPTEWLLVNWNNKKIKGILPSLQARRDTRRRIRRNIRNKWNDNEDWKWKLEMRIEKVCRKYLFNSAAIVWRCELWKGLKKREPYWLMKCIVTWEINGGWANNKQNKLFGRWKKKYRSLRQRTSISISDSHLIPIKCVCV